MHNVAAYRLEHDVPDGPSRTAEIEQVVTLLKEWLRRKRADDPDALKGEFKSESSDARGSFEWQRARHGECSWQMLRLTEEFALGRQFETSISITDTGQMVVVYVTLASGLTSSAVTPVPIDAKCPRPVRDILKLHSAWYHGPTKIREANRVEGREAGRHFAEVIRHANRTLPLIVISEDEGELALPGLDDVLSHALAGLANVTVTDDEASWGITEVLGKGKSCFWGSIRIYWPRYEYNQHPFWTERRIHDDGITSEQFAGQLRALIMQMSALSVIRPAAIDKIRRDVQRSRFMELQNQLQASRDWEQFANEYDALLEENRTLQGENQRLQTELQNAEALLNSRWLKQPTLIPDAPEDANSGPKRGETRYYKKVGSKKKYDMMLETGPCNHSSWLNANAPKAEKGIARLAGRKDWKSLYHCGSCTGGGMWKVVW